MFEKHRPQLFQIANEPLTPAGHLAAHEYIYPPEVMRLVQKPGAEIARAKQINPDLQSEAATIYDLIETSSEEMFRLDCAARSGNQDTAGWRMARDQERIKKIFIINLSKHGTYIDPWKNDAYANFPWAAWMDRVGADQAALLACQLALQRTRQVDQAFSTTRFINTRTLLLAAKHTPEEMHDMIRRSRIHLIYSGKKNEYEPIKRALHNQRALIPHETVTIRHNKRNFNTYNQLEDLAQYFTQPKVRRQLTDAMIIFVLYAPQAVRAMRMYAHLKNSFPQVPVAVAPLPTSNNAIPEYPMNEVRGIVYYFLANQTVSYPPPYHILPLPQWQIV